MIEKWKIVRCSEQSVLVITTETNSFLVRTDGTAGIGFVKEYLRETEKHYRSHLLAVDMILQRQMGDKYYHIRKVPNVYQAHLAIVSLCCRSTTDCPLRPVCAFNGFHPSAKEKRIVGCNPVYELSLTPTQIRAANLLVNTAYTLSDLAEILCLSESRVRSLASIIYATLGVDNRQELAILLRGKRIL